MKRDAYLRMAGVVFVLSGSLLHTVLPATRPALAASSRRDAAKPGSNPAAVFEENLGQYDPQVRFAGKARGQTVFMTADEATFVVPVHSPRIESDLIVPQSTDRSPETNKTRDFYALKMKFAGANTKAESILEEALAGKLGYFKGSGPSAWVADVPRYARAVTRNIYTGIDLAWHGNEAGEMEYDMIAAPGADPSAIRLEFDGADKLSVDVSGGLLIETPAGTTIPTSSTFIATTSRI